MSYPINYPTPQGANVQIFNCVSKGAYKYQPWVKPQGASMVWFTLIGGGGGGGGTDGTLDYFGGGSSAVTHLMIPAFLVPDNLSVSVGSGGDGASGGGNLGGSGLTTSILTILDGNVTELVAAYGGDGGDTGAANGGVAANPTPFTIAGFFQSVAGQDGSTSGGASGTTFLSGGAFNGYQDVNYGYSNGSLAKNTQGAQGYFQMSPIMVGLGGNGNNGTGSGNGTYKGGIGCGGAGASASFGVSSPGSAGGNGFVVIITW